MTADHEDMTMDDMDPLMVVLTGAPLSEEARADAAFLAGHRAAAADVALLREQLGIIGDALAGTGTVPAMPAVVRPLRRRRYRALAGGVLAAACAAAVLSGMGWLLAQSDSGSSSGSSSSSAIGATSARGQSASGAAAFGSPGYLACARVVAEGEVTGVTRVPGGAGLRVTLRVVTTYASDEPQRAGSRLTFVIDGSAGPGVHKGVEMLVGIPRHAARPDQWFVGDGVGSEREVVRRSLPQARRMTCE